MLLAHIQPLIAQHGYWVVFVIVMLESAGVPLPGETILILAAGYAGATGELNLTLVITCAAAGAIVGDNIGFWIGRTFGANFLLRYGKFVHLPESRLKLGQYLFEKHGAKIVFFGRFVAFLRVFAALLAGVNKYGWPQFLFFNAAGGITWAIAIGVSAYVFGDSDPSCQRPAWGDRALRCGHRGLCLYLFCAPRGKKDGGKTRQFRQR